VLDLGGTTSASGINDSGEVVGGTSSGGGSFLYSDGNVQYLHLPTLGGSGSGVIGINDSGQLTGNSSLAGNLVVHAFLYGNGSMVDLGTLGGSFSYAAAINNNGQVTGLSSTKFNAHAFLYSDGHMQDLGTLSGRENDFSQGIAINDLGEVVGYSKVDGDWRAFLCANGSMQDLGTLGGDASAAHGINDSGEVVGSSVTGIDGFAGSDAFLYDDGSMYNLTSLIGNEYSCVWLTSATAINNRGQILANGIDKINHNEYAFVLTPTNSPNSGENSSTVCAVSEPGTLGLFALGVTGLGVALRRRPLRRQ
jgi:probable HAF family extracellular repeat protein